MKRRPIYGPYLYAKVQKRKGLWKTTICLSTSPLYSYHWTYAAKSYDECVTATRALLPFAAAILRGEVS